MKRAFLFVLVSACSSAAASSATQPAPNASDASTPQAPPVDACAPPAFDAGDVCLGQGTAVALFPAPSDALTAACRAILADEAKGAIAGGASANAPAITVPADGDVVSAEHWISFAWSKGPAASDDGTYVVEFKQGCFEIVRAVVQGTGWPVDPPSWARMKGVTGPITMTVVWAGDSPVESAPVSFTMGP